MPIGRQKKKNGDGETPEVNIAPLIDVVFLLVVFFMSIWQAAHMETKATLTLPRARQGNPELPQDRDRFIINIDEHGDIYVSNRRLTEGQLARLLEHEREASHDEAGFARRPVFIRADAELPFREVQQVMRMCMQHKVWKLSLRTIEPDEES